MNDFTSSLYLGISHAKVELPAWKQLTTGRPAALTEPVLAQQLGQQLALLQGFRAGLVGPSTLHFFWDLFGMLDPQKYVLFADAQLYPVGASGVERAKGNGMQVLRFRHLNKAHLKKLISSNKLANKRPVVVSDGWCPRCGQPAPLPAYLALIRPYNGLLIIDDTQGLGVLGTQSTRSTSYGRGGGGIIKWWNLKGSDILLISSLAKGLGVPMASLCGSARWINRFRRVSMTRSSNSPVSQAHLVAAQRALSINRNLGDKYRLALWKNVHFFKQNVGSSWRIRGGFFPVQTLPFLDREQAIAAYRYLMGRGIETVLVGPHQEYPIGLMFIIRADHQTNELRALAGGLLELASLRSTRGAYNQRIIY